MAKVTFKRATTLPASVEDAFAWHERPGAFERLAPPWQSIRVVEREGTIHDGDRLVMELSQGPFRLKWIAQHSDFFANRQFTDEQIKGPFASWRHVHQFEPLDATTCRLTDNIEYQLPMGGFGKMVAGKSIEKSLDRLFDYRHQQTANDLALLNNHADQKTLSVAITGSSGLVGSALKALLKTGGHEVIPMVRNGKAKSADAVRWTVNEGVIDLDRLNGVDAVVHLAGESIASGRWTKSRMRRIRDSRLIGTRKLVESLLKLPTPPRTLISASAIGYYGDAGETPIDETGPKGQGFLADLVRDWEAATKPALDVGMRVVLPRFGIILSPAGGALAKMITPFKLGVGGPIGAGRQCMSWVDLQDAVGAVYHALMRDDVTGPVNVTSPNPVTNRTFAKTLGKVLNRPAIAPLPAPAARLMFGKMADELLLAGCKATPGVLQKTDYAYRHTNLEDALRTMLGRPAK